MPKDDQSKLGRGVQGELIPIEELPDSFYAGEEAGENAEKPRYTAERFFRKRPQDYELCVAFLAEGKGLLKIAKLLKVHHMTVAAVRDVEGARIDIQKERIRRNLRDVIDIGAERLTDIIATLPAGQVPLAVAICMDKLREMEAEPTAKVEITVKGHLTHEAVLASLAAFPDAIEVEAVPAGMVSGGETAGEKGLAAGCDLGAAGAEPKADH